MSMMGEDDDLVNEKLPSNPLSVQHVSATVKYAEKAVNNDEADAINMVAEPSEEQQTEARLPEDELTNYRLVIEERWRLFNLMMEARAGGNRRLTTYIGAAVGLLIFLALARPASLSSVQTAILLLAAGLGSTAIAMAADSLGSQFHGPGNYDWNQNHASCICLDTNHCLRQILADLLDACQSLEKAMNEKADAANWVNRLLVGQTLLSMGYWLSVTLS